MSAYVVKWIVDGEMIIEAADIAAAENAAQQILVTILSDEDKWPASLGVKGIQGAAEKVE